MATKAKSTQLSEAELSQLDSMIAELQNGGAGAPQPLFVTAVTREVVKVAIRAAGTAFCAVSEVDRKKLELMAVLANSLESNVTLDQLLAARTNLHEKK